MNPAWKSAIRRGDMAAIQELLATGADVNAKDRYGQTGVMLAGRDGHFEIIKVLIEHGADLNVTAKYNLSALMLAVINGHVDIARVLARSGADLSIRGTGAPGFAGKTAHDLAIEQRLSELGQELWPG
jgi:uncharacterized protein